jgi:hypothetical protein
MPSDTRVAKCIRDVTAKGGNVNPFAICQASTKQSYRTGNKLAEIDRYCGGAGSGKLATFSEGGIIHNAEIFATGTHKGKPYDHRKLDKIVSNFRKFSYGKKPILRVPAVIGHEEDQSYLENSGLPAAGWITGVRNVKRVCERCKGGGRHDGKPCENCVGAGTASILKADIESIPRQVKRLLDGKAYRTISAEIYPEPPEGVPGEGPMLRRVAYLGGEIPHVKSIGEIPVIEEHSERSTHFPVVLRFSEFTNVPAKGFVAFFMEASPMDREELIDKLMKEYGFRREALESADDELLAEMVRVHDSEKSDEEPDDEEVIDEETELPPDPERAGGGLHDVDESPIEDEKAFAEGFKMKFPHHYRAIAKHCSHADDADSPTPHGLLGSGTEKSRTAASSVNPHKEGYGLKSRQQAVRDFAEHGDNLRKNGIKSAEDWYRKTNGIDDSKPGLPRRAEEGKGESLMDKFSEQVKKPRGRWAAGTYDSFAEDFQRCMMTKPDFVNYCTKLSTDDFAKEQAKYKVRRLARAS